MAFYHSTKFPILWRSEYRTLKKWKHLTNFFMFCIQMLGIICFVLYSDAFKLTDQLMIEQMFVIWSPEKSVVQGQDSLRLNLYYLSLWLAVFQSKTTSRKNCECRAWWILAQIPTVFISISALGLKPFKSPRCISPQNKLK